MVTAQSPGLPSTAGCLAPYQLLSLCLLLPTLSCLTAEYIKMADQYVPVPGGPNNNNYANVELIIDIAKRIPVQVMVHSSPGVATGRGGDGDGLMGHSSVLGAMQQQVGVGKILVHASLCLQAVWAGWGHASENPKLPELLCKHEIAFLGNVCPPSDWDVRSQRVFLVLEGAFLTAQDQFASLGGEGVGGPERVLTYGNRNHCGYRNGVMLC
jgi:hypothetical protein